MRKLLLISIIVILGISLKSETIISDKQQVSGTWSKKGSPYIIQGEAIVPAGKTLIIKPGVVVKFKTGSNRDYSEGYSIKLGFLRVNGTIVAKGSSKKPILFTRFGNTEYWGVVLVDSREKGSVFSNCHFEYGYYVRSIVDDDNATAALSFINSYGEVSNCVFANNGWTGINCKKKSDVKITNCTVVENNYGIECNSGSNPVILNTIIWGNETNFYINGESKPVLSYCFAGESYLNSDFNDKGNNFISSSTDPGFVDMDNKDFHLGKSSPLLKKGEKGKNIGAY